MLKKNKTFDVLYIIFILVEDASIMTFANNIANLTEQVNGLKAQPDIITT